jgi:hypothetical protein
VFARAVSSRPSTTVEKESPVEEITKLVTEKAGISPDQAQKAVGGGAGTGGMANAAEGAVGGLFGTK